MKQTPPDPPNPYAADPPPPPPPPGDLGTDPNMRLLLPVGRSAWAIAAGYLGLFALLVIPAPLALIVSIIAIYDIKKSRASDKPKFGMGRAVFGLIVGALGTTLLAWAFLQGAGR